jgi:hypothetical protein
METDRADSREDFERGTHPALRRAGKREVDLYIRTYTTLLQSSGVIGVSSLEPAHINVASALHAGATEVQPDMSAFMYSTQRLPSCIVDVRHIVLGQSVQAFRRSGYSGFLSWEQQSAPGRRRHWHYDGHETLAATIASASDLDDLIPTIVAYQIEWNKFHRLIRADESLMHTIEQAATESNPERLPSGIVVEAIGAALHLQRTDWDRLQQVWGDRLWVNLHKMASERKRYTLRMLGGTYVGYNRAAHQWWQPVQHYLADNGLTERPIYFISSNTHSFVNVLSGAAMRRRDALRDYIRKRDDDELLPELERLERGESRSPWENLLYFAARPYFQQPGMESERKRRSQEERELGIVTLEPTGAIDVGVQVIDVNKLDPSCFDPRLGTNDSGWSLDPKLTDAVIVNINYPLGLAAYHILSQLSMSGDWLRGIYVLGKAATLNARIGDVMLSDVVFDEHSGNTYWFDNCFNYDSLAPYLVYGAALDNQKAVTVKGTYLQNEGYLDFYYRENYTVVEMEAGPYLNAIYEDRFLRRYPEGEAINLQQHGAGKMDLGVIHYASDTPYTRAQTLGARGLSYYGMDSTYASTIAILRRVFQQSGVLSEIDVEPIPEPSDPPVPAAEETV